MITQTKARWDPWPVVLRRSAWTILFFLLLSAAVWAFFRYVIQCIDGCGPYHNTTSVADLNDDGSLDVIVANLRKDAGPVRPGPTLWDNFWAGPTLWMNQGAGKFSPLRVDFGGPSTAAGDLDGDGDADILQLEAFKITLYLNQGRLQGDESGKFQIGHSTNLIKRPQYPSSPAMVVLGDLNNDGRLDAFIGDCCGMVLENDHRPKEYVPSISWVWINTPDAKGLPGGEGYLLTSLGDLPLRPALGDLDGDGDLDVFAAVVTPRAGAGYILADRVLLNNGSGSFQDSGQLLSTGDARSLSPLEQKLAGNYDGSTSVALGDLDSDGDLDALVGNGSGAAVWVNQGKAQGGREGTFTASTPVPGKNTDAVFLADLDGDGDLDALLGGKKQARLWWNDGQARFMDSGRRFRYSERDALAIGDFNADGRLDIFASGYDLGYHLWLNQGDGKLRDAN